ncbi:MAG: hypothetical protein ACTSVY_16195 [Candidatus Helarchaeota archaeon]
MVYWPNACVGCGDTTQDKLKDNRYTYRHNKLINRSYTGTYGGANHYTDTYEVTTLQVHVWTCPVCDANARNRYILGNIIFLINFILSIVIVASVYGATENMEFEFEVELFFGLFSIFWIISSFILVLNWIFSRKNFAKHYHKVRKKGDSFKFIFRSRNYLEIFKRQNPNADIHFSSWFP